MESSAQILERIRLAHRKDIDLGLRPDYYALLEDLGHPEDALGTVVHVAGTNGKGSVCAFLRAMIEASGRTVNVYTSPHLIRFHERVRLGGALIAEDELVALLREVEAKALPGALSVFEAATAAALAAFARHPADVTILEVGLGGRLDATNVVRHPCVDVITRLSFDHREYLGETMEAIAREKAGILRRGVPCFTAPQPSGDAMLALRQEAELRNVPLGVGGEDWRIEAVDEAHFRFLDPVRKIEMIPRPALLGTHQLWNAGLAMAASAALPFDIEDDAVRQAMGRVYWPGRLQHLACGSLAEVLPSGWELWVDGGHNDSAGEVIAAQMNRWQRTDGKPLFLLYGMLSTKNPEEFLAPLAPYISGLRAVQINGEVPGFAPEDLVAHARSVGIGDTATCGSLDEALSELARLSDSSARVLACGSLVLAGAVLAQNG